MKRPVEIRYGASARLLALVPLVVFAVSVALYGVRFAHIPVLVGVAFWAVYVFSYRIRIDQMSIRARYFPLHEKSFEPSQVTLLKEERTLTLCLPEKKLRLWGISPSQRLEVLKLYPDTSMRRSVNRGTDLKIDLRNHLRRTKILALFLTLSLALALFFFGAKNRNEWHDLRRYAVFAVMDIFLAFVLQAGITLVLLLYNRDIEKINTTADSE